MKIVELVIFASLIVVAHNGFAFAQGTPKPGEPIKADDFAELDKLFADKCVDGNCVNGKGKKEYVSGNTYEGDFVSGNPHGRGTSRSKAGQVYVGEFANGRFTGQGKITFPNGETYEGGWLNDQRSGKGKAIYLDGEVYEGDWLLDKRHGLGRCVYANGDIYNGDWASNNRAGKGTYTFKNGNTYVGEWKGDKWNGQGKYYAKATSSTQEGTWKDYVLVTAVAAVKQCVSGNCTNGIGTAKYPSGDIYAGNFVNGSPSGKGKTRMSDGSTYEGNYLNGKAEGQGIFTHKGGSVYTGNFANNVNHGRGKITYPDGNSYDGEWLNGKFEGQGTYAYRDGSYYTGEWKNGQQNGYGKQYNKPADKLYEGIWKDDYLVKPSTAVSSTPTNPSSCLSGNCLNGYGKYRFENGAVYEGNFANGKASGKGKMTYVDGSTYVGDLANGKMEGRGIYLYANGNTYDGGWVNNIRSGQATQTLKASGEVYIGQFAGDTRNGKGRATYKNGDSYDGDWVNGLREGQATYTFPNGSYYIGGFKNDKQDGLGKQFNELTNNLTEGTWKDGKIVNFAGATKITPTASAVKLPIDGIATQLRETLNGKYDYLEKKPLTYIFTNKKTGEVLRYQIEFVEDGGKLAFRWKESTKKEQSGKLIITDAALSSATKYVNFFSTKTAIAPDAETAFILSQKLHKDMKYKDEISLDLGNGVKRLHFLMGLTASSGTYTDKNVKVLRFQAHDGVTKVQILDDPICPLIVKIETAEYTLTLV